MFTWLGAQAGMGHDFGLGPKVEMKEGYEMMQNLPCLREKAERVKKTEAEMRGGGRDMCLESTAPRGSPPVSTHPLGSARCRTSGRSNQCVGFGPPTPLQSEELHQGRNKKVECYFN